jgi:hypothetical protein
LTGIGAAARGEFEIPLADIGFAADSEPNPLAEIAAQVKHYVSNRILILGTPKPDLVGMQLVEANADAVTILLQFVAREIHERLLQPAGCHVEASPNAARRYSSPPVFDPSIG